MRKLSYIFGRIVLQAELLDRTSEFG
ncbi:uncharacterized protein METZ01_LOCUS244193 [marine metagenome]|uniref:Uncharacterized protein n=1 Tax=marine metagenome TaxID=408172 RepID=A0A382HVX9_9ZZZZ